MQIRILKKTKVIVFLLERAFSFVLSLDLVFKRAAKYSSAYT